MQGKGKRKPPGRCCRKTEWAYHALSDKNMQSSLIKNSDERSSWENKRCSTTDIGRRTSKCLRNCCNKFVKNWKPTPKHLFTKTSNAAKPVNPINRAAISVLLFPYDQTCIIRSTVPSLWQGRLEYFLYFGINRKPSHWIIDKVWWLVQRQYV